MTDEEGEWSPWEKEGPDEGESLDVEEEEQQPLIVTVPHPLEVSHTSEMMDGSTSTTSLLLGGAPSVIAQYITTLAATMGALGMGCVIGYSSPAGPLLLSNSTHNPVHISEDQNNWFASSLSLGALVGAPLCGIGLTTIGRKGTMLISVVPFIVGWIIIAFAKNFAMLMAGRIFTGLCCGITSMVVPTYISEFSSPSVRGTLGTSFQLMVTLGVVYAYTIGAFVSWQLLAGLCAIPPAIYFVSVFFCKESPRFLLLKGKEEQAAAALQFFRGKHYHIQTELDMLRSSMDEARENKATFRDLLTPSVLKPLLISISLMFFQQFSGVNPVLFNLAIIFKDSGSTIKPAYCSIIIGIVQVASTFLAVVLMDRAGRKILLIVSSSFMAVSLIVLGEFCYLKMDDSAWAESTLGWLPLVCLIVYITAFSVGYGPIPWLMMGELFPPNVKEIAVSVATLSNWSLSFISTVIFLPLKVSIGDYGVYWMFSSICILNLIFCTTVVPETKGKSLEEITAYFEGSTSNSSRRSRSDL